jgi:hypothetical protein
MDAMVIGEDAFINRPTRTDFQRSGTYHVLVVSGMNVSILALVTFWFLRRLRARGRQFVFHVPLDLSAQAIMRGTPIRKARAEVGHLHYFTKDTALATLDSTGYSVEDWSYTYGSLDLPDRSLWQRVARVPRRIGLALAPDLTVRTLGGCSLLVLAR